MKPRDTQRERLYRAERELHTRPTMPSMAECQAYLDKVQRRAALRDKYGSALTAPITLHHGAGNRNATAAYWSRVIKLPKWARQEIVLLHEISHLVAGSGAAHGAKFATVLLDLTRSMMGVDKAERLAASFNLHGVKVLGSDGKERKPRVPKSQREWFDAEKARRDQVKQAKAAERRLERELVAAAIENRDFDCPTCKQSAEVEVKSYLTGKMKQVSQAVWRCAQTECWEMFVVKLTYQQVQQRTSARRALAVA